MKRRLKQIALLALAVLVIFLLHKQVRKEREEAEAHAAAETEQTAQSGEDAAAPIEVMRAGNGVTLGTVRENTERGGIDVTLSDGTVYTFTDVAIDSWYTNAVNFVVSAGLMTGIENESSFQPEFGILREAFASILYRFAHGEPSTPRSRFSDVEAGSWYFDAVSWATNERLMSALEPGVFGVGSYMTCEQALIGLYRLAGSPKTDGSLENYPYASKVSEAGRSAVDWAWKNGLITEVECVWYPTQAISRAQVALLLMRYSVMN